MRKPSVLARFVYGIQILATIALMFFTFGYWAINPPPAIVKTRKEIAETSGN